MAFWPYTVNVLCAYFLKSLISGLKKSVFEAKFGLAGRSSKEMKAEYEKLDEREQRRTKAKKTQSKKISKKLDGENKVRFSLRTSFTTFFSRIFWPVH